MWIQELKLVVDGVEYVTIVRGALQVFYGPKNNRRLVGYVSRLPEAEGGRYQATVLLNNNSRSPLRKQEIFEVQEDARIWIATEYNTVVRVLTRLERMWSIFDEQSANSNVGRSSSLETDTP